MITKYNVKPIVPCNLENSPYFMFKGVRSDGDLVASGFGSTMIAISTGYSFKTNSNNGQTKSTFRILGRA